MGACRSHDGWQLSFAASTYSDRNTLEGNDLQAAMKIRAMRIEVARVEVKRLAARHVARWGRRRILDPKLTVLRLESSQNGNRRFSYRDELGTASRRECCLAAAAMLESGLQAAA